ncbi:hypothetical protein D9758_004828 [Tetrapyrgos nigripes]|uniref:Peptidase S28 n=1 Tax=Tetrapyrgos nigripes TaxID=182062 RepID=A0A8H5G5T8_9AGAR|nr:hypothetical protein D9758_004828 [Tetrapyrgos nigripes]
MFLRLASLLPLLWLPTIYAVLPDGRRNANMMRPPSIPVVSLPDAHPVVSRNGTQLPPYNFTYYFDQLIDHNNPSLGTFKQRFWHTYEFYEPGPIVLMTPGEANAQRESRPDYHTVPSSNAAPVLAAYTGYLTNTTITGATAQQNSGSVIILEHRFYGLSNPKPDLSGKSLQGLHTIQQAIDDLEYFAFNVNLPQPDGENLAPDKAPWILAGGSYSGALTSYTLVNKPDVFAAGYASSAVVETILDYWGYFEPIRQFMPQNCSADVERVIAYVDEVFSGDNQTAIDALKANWGLGSMTHLDDVAGVRNNLWDWQSLQPTSGNGTVFSLFCDALETDWWAYPSGPDGYGLDWALNAWGNFWTVQGYIYLLCDVTDPEECLGTYNPSSEVYTDTSLDNAGRSWYWIVCNEVGFLQDGPPENVPAVVSRLTKPESDIRQCELMFSDVFSESNPPPMADGVAKTNEAYHGWNVSVDHLFFANGQRDPWREATLSADGVNVASTSSQPIAVGDGFHCSDLSIANGKVDPTIKAVQNQWFSTIPGWLKEWTPGKVKMTKRGVVEERKVEQPVVKRAVNAQKKASISAVLPDGRRNANMMKTPAMPVISLPDAHPVVSRNGTELPPYNFTYYFDQLIDHNNPSVGTFKQRFWHTYEFYEPGPIVLMTPGEANAEPYSGYLTNRTITGTTAQRNNGSVIILEHRFYGLSNPKPDLSGKSLQGLHTLQQAIDDLEYFAFNVKLPQPDGENVSPDKAPWILEGGSYSGALTSWTMVNKPNLFAAGYASSAVVEAILDYWGYFEPIRQFMPKNCSADVERVIAHIDKVFSGDNQRAIDELKDNWGLGNMTHLDDVAGVRNNLWDWQSLQPTSGPNTTFFKFCDALETDGSGKSAPAQGAGLETALNRWGNFWTDAGYLDNLCGNDDPEDCLGTYDPTSEFYTDTSIDNAGRSWNWIVCNEVGYLQDGPPKGVPAVVSRLTKPESDIRQCELMFSDVFSARNPPKMANGVARTNEAYHGWNVSIEHLFFANGQRDPWREATVSADGVNVASTSSQPIAIGDGFHCSDLSIASGGVDPTIKVVQDKWFSTIPRWLEEWTPGKAKMTKRGVVEDRKVEEPVVKRAVGARSKASSLFFREPEQIL